MNTAYSEIVNDNFVGSNESPISMNEILAKASTEKIESSHDSIDKVLLLAIDVQQDFMDNGSLGVPGAIEDVKRINKFIYNNMNNITNIAVSLDTHIPQQIFHPCWWIDENGNNPAPYTVISLADLDSGKWRAIVMPKESRNYVENLEKNGKKLLCVWTYHCIQGTSGSSLENQFANMVYFHSVAKKAVVKRLVKGLDPLSEMYGIIRPEYDTKGFVNIEFINALSKFNKIIIVGEAKSHCVLESIKQILDTVKSDICKKIYILEDCMSSIPGFEDLTDKAFSDFKKQYSINIVKSTDKIF